ncbi:type II secretion system protein [Roseateles albus]|uniref:Type II secretion system protein n=1 Tax=Roseateles albus TaxID=2987525 RepID=A0ABT5KAQ2_9BURK|nr:type II secretion system protein [Roseateles albus]MDC8771007.1 type II secretion system protein [Roseateles albus]
MRIGKGKPATNRGFTYLWLLFVVALGGVALASLGQRQQTVQQREREAELRFRGEAIARAIESYVRSSPGDTKALPQRLEELLEDRRSGTVRRHLRRLYLDPFTGRADWALIQGQLALKPAAQNGAVDESEQLLHKRPEFGAAPGITPNPALGSVTISAEQGAALASGIVGVSSRSRALLLATDALPNGVGAGFAPSSAGPKASKPRVSQLQFLAASDVVQSE